MAPWRNFILDKGFDAAAAITKYRGVKLHANPEAVTPVVASTDIAVGVAQESVTAAEITKGKGASVAVMGITVCEAGAAIAKGAEVMFNASGKVIAATGAGNRAIGMALEAAAADLDQIPVALNLPGRVI